MATDKSQVGSPKQETCFEKCTINTTIRGTGTPLTLADLLAAAPTVPSGATANMISNFQIDLKHVDSKDLTGATATDCVLTTSYKGSDSVVEGGGSRQFCDDEDSCTPAPLDASLAFTLDATSVAETSVCFMYDPNL